MHRKNCKKRSKALEEGRRVYDSGISPKSESGYDLEPESPNQEDKEEERTKKPKRTVYQTEGTGRKLEKLHLKTLQRLSPRLGPGKTGIISHVLQGNISKIRSDWHISMKSVNTNGQYK